MKQEDLDVIIGSIKNCFSQYGDDAPVFSTPFIERENDMSGIIRDYTGAIAISGDYKGAMYISFAADMLRDLTRNMLDGDEPTEEDIVDNAGELANTISGNAREKFGRNFNISTPLVIRGKFESVELPQLSSPMFVIPFTWKTNEIKLCIGFDREQ